MDTPTIDKLSKAIMNDLRPIVATEVTRQMNEFVAERRQQFEDMVDSAIYRSIREKVDRTLNIQVTIKGNDNG